MKHNIKTKYELFEGIAYNAIGYKSIKGSYKMIPDLKISISSTKSFKASRSRHFGRMR